VRIDRRQFLKAGIAAALSTIRIPQEPSFNGHLSFDLAETTIGGLQEAMRAGRETARSITAKYLARIASCDKQGPALRSIIEVNPDAMRIAEELDVERLTRGPRGPLHGIPVLLKDNVGTFDRMTTTAGSFALEGSIPGRDSFVARRLREEGAVLIGKANLSEWANFRSTRSSSGWSARGGQCRNPYALDRNPCGSSSGSGVATSANLCVAAVGTETDGSIVCPSSSNGIVGIKPTVGLVSRTGIIPISRSQDTAGPMARTVTDAAILLGAMAGADRDDETTTYGDRGTVDDYTAFLDANGLEGARIGVARNFFGFHPGVDALMEAAIDVMRKAGATVVDRAGIPTRGRFERAEVEVLLYEFKDSLNAYLSTLGNQARVKSLADIIDFNERNRELEMPFFGQERFLAAQAKGLLTSPEYLEARALAQRLTRREGIDAVMDTNRLDAIIGPTGGPSWATDHVNGDRFIGGSSSPAAVAGYPNITVPCGFIGGLPVGISFFGRAWSEGTLLKIAFAFEQRTKHRRPPQFVQSADTDWNSCDLMYQCAV
jgi:amidase